MEQQQTDEKFMRLALNEAEKALEEQEVPIGAVVVADGRIVGRGHNLVETLADATAHAEMQALAAQLPEYPVVMAMHGVGDSLGPQLMAELGDVARFTHRNALTAFAGVDPGADQSGTHEAKSTRVSKSGPPELRRALFLVMDCLLKTQPQDDPVYRFMDKKRAEGKPYLVYMTAGANKFLRIYYGRVKEYLASLEEN